MSCFGGIALAADQRDDSERDLRKEIADLHKVIVRLTNRMEAMEQRLSKLEKAASSRMVPEAIDRGMLMDSLELEHREPGGFREMEQMRSMELEIPPQLVPLTPPTQDGR